MRIVHASLFFLFGYFQSLAQISNSEMKLKEFFDFKKPTVATTYATSSNIFDDHTKFSHETGADDLAEVNAPVMDAQLVLYETTKDKGYLINFINDAIQMMSMRADYMQSRLGTYKYKNV